MSIQFESREKTITVIFLILAGFVLRIYDLGAQSLWLDEAISSNAAVAFLNNGTPTLPSGILYERGLLNTFLIAFSFKLFGVGEFAARLPSVLFGTLTILLVYFIGSRWGNGRIGIIAAFLVAFSVWEIAWSRQARMYQELQFFYVLSIFAFYEFTENRRLKWLLLLAVSSAGAVLSHEFGYVLLLVFGIYLIIVTLREQHKANKFKPLYIFKTLLIFAVLSGFAYYKGIISSVMSTETDYYDTYIYLLKKDMGIFLFLAVPGGTVLMNRDWKRGLLLISALIIPLYFIFFHVLLLGTRYLYFVIPVMFILVAYFLDLITGGLESYLPKIRYHLTGFSQDVPVKAIAGTVMALVLISSMYFSQGFTFTPREEYDLGINAFQSDFRKAYGFVKDNMEPDDAILSTWTPPSLFYLGKSDYWLAFNVVGTGEDSFVTGDSSHEVYTNAVVIRDVGALKNATQKHGRGWIVTDNLAWVKLNPGMREYIEKNTDKKLQDPTIRVYMWNGSGGSPVLMS